MTKHFPPQIDANQFICPFCHVFASQTKCKLFYEKWNNYSSLEGFALTECRQCDRKLVWHDGQIVYPEVSIAPSPHEDLPEELLEDFEEARIVLSRSPRSAAALLRLLLQKFLKHLGESGNNINDDIASLVKKGLPLQIQQALDAIRILGNESVHPGEINLNDTPEVAATLFRLINFIVDDRISHPKRVTAVYDLLPAKKKDGVAQRDKV